MSTQTAGPMDSAADFSFRINLKAVPVLFDSPPTFKFMHNNKHKHDREPNTHASPNVAQNDDESSASQTMSIAFREVFKSYADVKEDKHSLKQETQQERMLDSFSRGEKLLNSEDNVRPTSHSMSRSKTSANVKESKENITDIEERLKRSATKSITSVHSHILESRVNENYTNPKTPTSPEGQRNVSNNAEDLCLDKSMKSTKKGKKHRKRSNSVSVKTKKGKQGRMTVASTGTHYQLERDFHGSVSPTSHTSIKHNSSRVSSEPANLLSRYEYVPSMGDIRSQQAVKKKLQVMERDAHKKKEKQKEEKVKQEKQQMKDREKALKAKQRREIYALNKIMTDLEYQRFLEFCKSKGLKL